MNFDALYMSFSSILRFFDHAYFLKQEVSGVATTFTTLKFLQVIYSKVHNTLSRILGHDVEMKQVWDQTSTSQPSISKWAWIPVILAISITYQIFKWIWKRLFQKSTNDVDKLMNEAMPPIEQMKDANGNPIPQNGMPMQNGMMGMNNGMNMGMNGMNSMYGSSPYGNSYGSSYGGYGMGSSYGGMGMNSSYGGYGSSYGGMGSSYGMGMGMGGYGGSSYGGMGGYGNSYGGY
jgi:hypothetical protein